MRRLRALLAILTMMAMAMLPGPSHALAYAAHGTHASARHSTDAARLAYASWSHELATHGDEGLPCDHHRGTAHEPCKTCSIACCAPITAAIEAPSLAVAKIEQRLRPMRPRADRDRPDAAQTRALRPPTAAA